MGMKKVKSQDKPQRHRKRKNSRRGSWRIKRAQRWYRWARAAHWDKLRRNGRRDLAKWAAQEDKGGTSTEFPWEMMVITRDSKLVKWKLRALLSHRWSCQWTRVENVTLRLLAKIADSQLINVKCGELTEWWVIRKKIPRKQWNQLSLKISYQ